MLALLLAQICLSTPVRTLKMRAAGTVVMLSEHSVLGDGVCAFVASGLSTALLHPIDTIKTRLQSSMYADPAWKGTSSLLPAATARPPPESLFDHLYAGVASSMMKEVCGDLPHAFSNLRNVLSAFLSFSPLFTYGVFFHRLSTLSHGYSARLFSGTRRSRVFSNLRVPFSYPPYGSGFMVGITSLRGLDGCRCSR